MHASAVGRALDVDKVVKAVSKQLKEKSFRTKERCFELLRELVLVLDGGLQPYLGSFVPDIEKSIDKVCMCVCLVAYRHTSDRSAFSQRMACLLFH